MVGKLFDEEAIFKIAAGIPAQETRDEYLQQVCGDDEALLHRVLILLRAHDESPSFLEAPPPGIAATAPAAPRTEELGTLIGPYKLLEQIGEGGMGLVYMAEQQRPMRRLVALKLIKPGMDSKQVIARFEAEKQALAMMDHENIAKVFEAGTTDTGRFYFAMELVRGIPINEFCDQKCLTVRERLELFIQVCQAVQHAHQKGIIHRDLKPTNVLVTMHDTVAVPKVIDFGIAKALQPPLPLGQGRGEGVQLTEHTLHTGFAQLVGTPLYMSPEQAEMNQLGVDTRSDVYALGVLLYELLTGTTPFDKERLKSAGLDEFRRIIREEEPETVSNRLAKTRSQNSHSSALSPQPRTPRLNELDWIVARSLEKDRTRRYESASALAADIQRYLADEPVLACPPSAAYRLRKFVRRYRGPVLAASLLLLALAAGIIGTTWGMIRATQAEAQAVKEAKLKDLALKDKQRALDESRAQWARVLAATSTPKGAEKFLRQAIAEGIEEYRLWFDLAYVQLELSDEAGYRQTCATLLDRFPAERLAQRAHDANSIAWVCVLAPDAVADYERVVALAEKAVALSGKMSAVHQQAMLNTLGAALYRARRFDEAIARLNEALSAHRKGGAASDWFFLAMAHAQKGDEAAARQWYEKAVRWMDENQASLEKNRRQAAELHRFRAEATEILKIPEPMKAN